VVQTTGGKIHFYNFQQCAELNQLSQFFSQICKEDDKIYIHNWAVQYYFLFKLRNPTPFDGLLPGHNSEEQYRKTLEILQKDPPEFILTDHVLRFITEHPEKSPFTGIAPEILTKDSIWDFIRNNYKEIAFFNASGLVLWKRTTGVN